MEKYEAVLHWEEFHFVRVYPVERQHSQIVLPLPMIVAEEIEDGDADPAIAIGGEAGWVFTLRGKDDHDVLHYYTEEPPWTAQIRSAMSYMRQRLAAAHRD